MIKKKILDIRAKARIRKSRKYINENIKNLFDWIKGAEIVELKQCEIKKDPVRPELDNEFRTSYGRKIYGVKYKKEIHAVMCFAFTNKITKTASPNLLWVLVMRATRPSSPSRIIDTNMAMAALSKMPLAAETIA